MPATATEAPPQQPQPSSTQLLAIRELLRRDGVGQEQIEAQLAAVDRPACQADPNHFIENYVKLHDEQAAGWVPFKLWPAQRELTDLWNRHRQIIGLKARQLGVTWHFLGMLLHLALFRPHSTALLFSRTEEEAKELLRRLRGMHDRLPKWLQGGDQGHLTEWRLTNGSVVKAFPTGRGDSYTATAVLLDEFDILTNNEQESQLQSVRPTTDGGGRLVVISRPDKAKPDSPFKKLYRAARERGDEIEWKAFFLPWYARPTRDQKWYEFRRKDLYASTGSHDFLHENYPATEQEALEEYQLGKRLPAEWLDACFRPAEPLAPYDAPAEALELPDGADALWESGLKIFARPRPLRRYCASCDPAEGLADSDDSAAEVLDAETLEEVASLAGKFSPAQFGALLALLCRWYNNAPVLPERNNHGHAVILWLKEKAPDVRVLEGRDGAPGWQTNLVSKALLYDDAGEVLREGACVLHDLETRLQLGSVERQSLKAPAGRKDDRAVAFVLAVQAAKCCPRSVYEDRGIRVLGGNQHPAHGQGGAFTALMAPGGDGDDLFWDDDE